MDRSKEAAAEPYQRLTELRNGLLGLHKTLLDSESAIYDHDVARITSRGHLLGLVMDDPWFAYLHDLSRLVVEIDERLDADEPATEAEAARFIQQARALITPAEQGQGFEKRYFEALQRDPNVVLAHGAMVRLLSTLREG